MMLSEMHNPPYRISHAILQLISGISELIGEIKATHLQKPPAKLRRENRIKTIQSSLEIEGNTLSIEQVTGILENKKVIAPENELIEVRNAIEVYKNLQKWKPFNFQSMLDAHKMLMKGLIETPGHLRGKAIGIARGSEILHLAPPGEMVNPLMKNLFNYLKRNEEILLIKSCVFHYELEFIHPFSDGNGRMGRLWQTLLLMRHSPVFEFLPVESIIRDRQSDYYHSLSRSDNQGNSTLFIEFMLELIKESLETLLKTQNFAMKGADRIQLYIEKSGVKWFSRKDYLRSYKDISAATASRDLREAVENRILERKGDKNTSRYRNRIS